MERDISEHQVIKGMDIRSILRKTGPQTRRSLLLKSGDFVVYRKEIVVAKEWRDWSLVKNAWRRTTMNPDPDMDVFGIWCHGTEC